VKKMLAEGGCGRVFAVYDASTMEKAAGKMVRRGLSDEQFLREKEFLQEYRSVCARFTLLAQRLTVYIAVPC